MSFFSDGFDPFFSCSVKGNIHKHSILLRPFYTDDLAYQSYLRVCGVGDERGDGFVPCCAGHLEGAVQINLSDVGHTYSPENCWYGSPNIIEQWHDEMMTKIVNADTNLKIE